MKILVTGGLGVVGSRLSNALSLEGHEVIITDKAVFKKECYERADITRYEEISRVFKNHKPQHVFHLAGEVGRENGEQFPRRHIEINESGTFNLAQLCIEFNSRLYYSSTSEVYGKLGEQRLTEDLYNKIPFRPTNIYGISKLHAENYLKYMVENYGLKALSYRFFMSYGPGEYPNPYRSAMTNFIHNLRRNLPISIHKGTKRSWCYVDDIVKGMILSMNVPIEKYDAYNLGSDDLKPMEEVAELICNLVGADKELLQLVDPPKSHLIPVKNASFEKAKKVFGFESKIELREGIKNTIAWHIENVKI